MNSNAVLDVAAGLVLMYLILSLTCTVLNEYIATVFKLRASTLKDAIEQLVDVPGLRGDFYNHGLVDGGAKAKGDHASYMSGRTFAAALLGSLDPTKPLPTFNDLQNAISLLPDSNIRDSLLAHVVAARGDLQGLRDGVATWFDHAMDRVGGIYKRYLKWVSIGIGFLLAFAINADSINVAQVLWRDGALRTQMAQSASSFVASNPTIPAAQGPAAGSVASNSTIPAAQGPAAGSDVSEIIKSAEKRLRPLPVGWNITGSGSGEDWPQTPTAWAIKFCGLFLTALALSLGAPFWFDLLSKFVNIRGTGVKPQRTEETQGA